MIKNRDINKKVQFGLVNVIKFLDQEVLEYLEDDGELWG